MNNLALAKPDSVSTIAKQYDYDENFVQTVKDTKTCSNCNLTYPKTTEYFYKARGVTLAAICKSCAQTKSTKHHFENHEAKLKAGKKYREENREKLREYHKNPTAKRKLNKKESEKLRRLVNGEKLRAAARHRYEQNKQPYIQRAKQWAILNPEKAAEYNRAKRFRRRGVEPDKTAREFMRILALDPCVYCGSQAEIVIDHIHPISKGGDSDFMNLTAACRSCNAAKSNKPLLNFLFQRRDINV